MREISRDIPWITQPLVDKVTHAFKNTHAILLNGKEGIGKSFLANKVCLSLLNHSNNSKANDLYQAGTHPDMHVLTSAFSYRQLDPDLSNFALRYLETESLEKKRLSRQISVETIRSFTSNMANSSALGGYKLAVIYPVENLNINSANALLKFLEEPNQDTLLILISHDISKLPATIRSRCMRINLALPDANIAHEWLAAAHFDRNEKQITNAQILAGYRPLVASHYLTKNQHILVEDLIDDIDQLIANRSSNIVAMTRKWIKLKQTDFILDWLCLLFSDAIKAKLSSNRQIQAIDYSNKLEKLATQLSIYKLFSIYDYFISVNQHYDGITDETLLIEDLMLTIGQTVNEL